MIVLTRRTILVLVVLGSVLLLGALGTYFIYLSPTGIKAKEAADLSRVQSDIPEAYISLSGEATDLEAFRDAPLVVNVWASWSPFTEADHVILSRIAAEYGEDVRILALNRKETKETAEAYLNVIGKKEGIEYIIDTTDHFFASLGGYAMPETVVFDAVGNEYYRKRGVIDEPELRNALNALREE